MIGSRPRHQPTWPTIEAHRPRRLPITTGLAVAAGIAIALSLPPFGWWPLGVVGLAGWAALLHRRPVGVRALVGAGVGLGQFAVGLWWVTQLNLDGYVALLALSLVYTTAAGALVPARRWGSVLVGFPAALVLTDWVRGHFPFGGLPLGGIALGQVGGPLVPVSRLGGPLLLTGAAAASGAAVVVLAHRLHRVSSAGGQEAGRRSPGTGAAVAAGVVLAAVVMAVAVGRFGPDGSGGGPTHTISVVAVQGGGPRGLHAGQVDPAVVFQRQVDTATSVAAPVDLMVWPEDVIQVDQPIADTPEAATVGQLARRLGTTIVAGVVEDVGSDRFRNAAVVWAPSGLIVARYDKVHRVPFGEYIPGRALFSHLANLDLVPRDAIAGHGPGLLDTPAGPLGTVISFEVFFEDRARAAIGAGGQLLVVPTNASSYRSSQVPSQEVAAARLRAWETGRDTIQAAPTGYSALIDHNGRVLARSVLGRPQLVAGRLTLRHGRTVFMRLGDLPVAALAALALIAASRLASRTR